MKSSRWILLTLALSVVVTPALPSMASAQAVTDDWASAKIPAEAPAVKAVTVDPKTTALIVMDFNKAGCSTDRRPRCVADLPNIAKVLSAAREHGMFVFHTTAGTTTAADIPPQLTPRPSEPVYGGAGPDKFVGGPVDLVNLLKGKGVTTLIAVGTGANGAELYTASGAAMRGFKVVVPVDCMPGDSPFTEGFSVWELAHAPRIGDNVTLTKSDLISFAR